MKGDVETYFENGVWKNKVEGNSRASNTARTEAEAANVGRRMARARKATHIIRTQDGKIGERNSYGNDPTYRGTAEMPSGRVP